MSAEATISASNVSRKLINDLIAQNMSFDIVGVENISQMAKLVESVIEERNLRCRVYTAGRIAAAGGTFFGGVTGALGIASAVGIAAHNLITFDPHYEISKHLIDNKIKVRTCRKIF